MLIVLFAGYYMNRNTQFKAASSGLQKHMLTDEEVEGIYDEAIGRLAEYYKSKPETALQEISKMSLEKCMFRGRYSSAPEFYFEGHAQIQEQLIIGLAANTPEAKAAAFKFKQDKLAYLKSQTKGLRPKQKKAVKKAVKEYDEFAGQISHCAITKITNRNNRNKDVAKYTAEKAEREKEAQRYQAQMKRAQSRSNYRRKTR